MCPLFGSSTVPERDKQCREKRERKGCVEGLGEEGEGREGRPHIFMQSIILAASLSNSDFRKAVWQAIDIRDM